MAGWNFADVWEEIARAGPDAIALRQGERAITWGQFDQRANALAHYMLAHGCTHQSKVCAYLYNCPEYIETYAAAFKASLAPFNANYRYVANELLYLIDNADAEVVVFHAGFVGQIEAIRAQLPRVKCWIAIAEPGHSVPDFATDYDTIVAADGPACVHPRGRSGDDLLLLYTGGTTGMPKGVMWRQDDLFQVLGAGGNALQGIPPLSEPSEAGARVQARAAGDLADWPPVSRIMAACPLMHGTAQFGAFIALNGGGASFTLPSRKFDPIELWDEVERTRATSISIVGQAFGAPMLEALDANPGRWDLSGLNQIGSSGVVWSQENKHGLLRHLPWVVLSDSLGSSEAVGLAGSVSMAGVEAATAKFMVGPNAAVFTQDGRRPEPGSGERGLIAVGGFIPVGYYKDPEKSTRTFRIVEGQRWSFPGDFAEVEADGTIKLLGRGSQVINTGGEKVFPEEVEEALKTHPAVRDAIVVGVPDPRFGERICALAELREGHAPDQAELAAHVKTQLADYKAPRHVVFTGVERAANGKVDYKAARELAVRWLSQSA